MSRARAFAFVCFVVSIIGFSPRTPVSAAAFHCSDQEACNDINPCGGSCSCTCDGENQWPLSCPGGSQADGFCLILPTN